MFKIFFIFIWKQAYVAFSLNKRKFHYLCRFYRLFRLNKFEFLLSKNVVPSLIEICPVNNKEDDENSEKGQAD